MQVAAKNILLQGIDRDVPDFIASDSLSMALANPLEILTQICRRCTVALRRCISSWMQICDCLDLLRAFTQNGLSGLRRRNRVRDRDEYETW